MINLKDVHSLSDFQRNARAYVEHLRETGRPQVLTVHGQAELLHIRHQAQDQRTSWHKEPAALYANG